MKKVKWADVLPDKKDDGVFCTWLKNNHEIDIWCEGYKQAINESAILLQAAESKGLICRNVPSKKHKSKKVYPNYSEIADD